MIIGIVGGLLGGLFHRFFISPFIGLQTYRAQSIGTPAAGVLVASIPMSFVFRWKLKRILQTDSVDADLRERIELAAGVSYMTVFFFYGLAVAVTILANIGGVRKKAV